MNTYPLTAIMQRKEETMLALCPELDIVSQGKTVKEAKRNLQEDVQFFLETASVAEVQSRLKSETFVTRLEIEVA